MLRKLGLRANNAGVRNKAAKSQYGLSEELR
jgi:hypothetical protein